MTQRYCALWIGLVVAFAGAREAHSQNSVSWKQRFLSEAPRKWEEYLERGKNFQGTRHFSTADLMEGGSGMPHTESKFRQNETCALSMHQSLTKAKLSGTLNARNSRYGFQLRRESANAPWVLLGHDVDLADGYNLSLADPATGIRNWVSSPFDVAGRASTRLGDLLEDRDFVVQDARAIQREGRTLVTITFQATPKHWTHKDIPAYRDWMSLRSGWITLDPNRYWVITECQAEQRTFGGSSITSDAKFEYTESDDHFPLLKRITRETRGVLQGKTIHIKNTEVFEIVEDKNVLDREFTLSAFGLPEPAGVKKPIPWWLWVIGVALVALIGGAGFTWLKRRTLAKRAVVAG